MFEPILHPDRSTNTVFERVLERPSTANSTGGGESEVGGFFTKARNTVRTRLGGDKAKQEQLAAEQAKDKAALNEAIAMSLAALAIQGYIKSVLCPSLSNYSPRVIHRPKVRTKHIKELNMQGLKHR